MSEVQGPRSGTPPALPLVRVSSPLSPRILRPYVVAASAYSTLVCGIVILITKNRDEGHFVHTPTSTKMSSDTTEMRPTARTPKRLKRPAPFGDGTPGGSDEHN